MKQVLGRPRRRKRSALLVAFLTFIAGVGILAASPATAQTETFVTVVDDQGPDQLDQGTDSGNSQQDITGARIGDQGSFGWAWDETDLSGNNSIDTCTYFEEADGTVISVCYSLEFEQDGSVSSGFPAFSVYDCGSDYSGAQQKCTGGNSIPVATDYTVDCGDPVLAPSYFTPDDQLDLQADCTLSPSDDLLLLNICTKTSASPSSGSNDCLFSDAVGFLQLEKVVLDGAATGADFTLTAGTLTGQGPTVALSPVTADDPQALSESSALIDDGTYEQVDVVCTDDGTDEVVDTTSGSVTVSIGQRVTCVFTNQLAEDPDIAIVKSAVDTAVTGSTVEYTYEVTTGTGNVALASVGVSDDKCSPVTFVGGDTNTDGNLDTDETWTFTCSAVLSETTTNTATATGSSPAGTPVQAQDDWTVTVIDPAITIDKSGILAGDTITYTFLVTNTGDVALDAVGVTDPLPGLGPITCDATTTLGALFAGNSTGSLDAGDAVECTALYTVDQTDIDAGQVDNTATVTGTPPVGPDVDATDPATVSIQQTPEIEIVKDGTLDIGADGIATPGDVISYTFDVTNLGNVTLNGVTVTDPLITDIDCGGGDNVIGTMAPTATVQCTGTYLITQVDIDAGSRSNTADADGLDPNGEAVNDDDDHLETIGQTPGLGIDKTLTTNLDEDGDGQVSVGDTLRYTITATNTGNTTLATIDVSDDLTGDDTSCSDVAPGGDCVLIADYTVLQTDVNAGRIDNTGTADSEQTDPVTADETVDVPRNPSVLLEKTGSLDVGADGVATPGDLISYELLVTNTGNVTLTGVLVSDPGVIGPTCPTDTLAPGANMTCTATYAITQADIDAGVYDNIASVATAEGPERTDDHTEPIPQAPALSVDKLLTGNADEDGSGDVSLGDTLSYSITATNDGNTTLAKVDVSDDLTGDSTTCDDIAPLGTCVLNVTYVVAPDDVEAGSVTNIGTADSEQTDPVDDPEVVPVTSNPAYTVDKPAPVNADEDGSGDVSVDDTLTYTITATNTGDITMDITVGDPLLTPDSIDCPAVGPGDTCVLIGTYVVDQDDVDAGRIDNTGTATSNLLDPITDDETVLIDRIADIDLVKNADPQPGADGVLGVGDSIDYDFEVTNTGNVTLTDVVIDDPLLGGVVCTFDSLAPGETDTCSGGSYEIDQTDVDAGGVLNVALAEGTPPAGVPPVTDTNDNDRPDDPARAPVTIAAEPALDITKSPDDQDVAVGGDATFTITVENVGNVTLGDVVISDPLAPDCDLVIVGPFGPGDSTTYDCTGVVVDDFTNTATASSTFDGEDVTDSDTADVNALPAITVDKSTDSPVIPVGGAAVEFTVTVTNDSGASDPVEIVSIVDDPYGDVLDPTNPNIEGTDCVAGTVIAPGDDYVCRFTVDLDGGELGDTFTDIVTVEVTDDEGSPADDSDDETVEVAKLGNGVGTPGYWKNHPEVWGPGADGVVEDPEGSGQHGLLIGDWNGNGQCDEGDCIFVPLDIAAELLDASQNQRGGDKRYTIGRALIAAWLNVKNACENADCIEAEIDAAIAWLKTVSNEGGEYWDAGRPVRGRAWSQSGAEALYLAMDDYNNTGRGCARDRDEI